MNLKDRINEDAAKTEKLMAQYFNRKFDAPDIVVSAMQYSLFAGGKRLRPVLMMETCKGLGGNVDEVMPLACAIEMIHTYSLIHDDLPAMDNDDLRRGKPTNHKVYGENIAILAGDALLNYAFEVAIEGIPFQHIAVLNNYIKALGELSKASGVNGMIGGQTGDILSEEVRIDEAKMYYIIEHKTGALIKAAVLCGAHVAGATSQEILALTHYSEKIGMAFQILDDILDVVGDENKTGKPSGSDEKNHKTTFVSLYGIKSAKVKLSELEAEANEALAQIQYNTEFLSEIAHFICNRDF